MSELAAALELHRAGDFAAAERAYRVVLAAQPESADALALLGVALEAQGRAAEAISFIRRAVVLDPQAALFRLYLGNALLATGQAGDAVPEFQQAVALQPQSAETHYNLGNALRAAGQDGEAVAAYRACIALHPHFPPARNNLALLLAAAGDHAGALAELRRVLAEAPQDVAAQINLANVADAAGDHALALQAAERALALAPDHPDALFAQALALNRGQRDAEAAAVWRRLTVLRPERARAWDNLGQTLQALGQLDAAESAYREALTRAPEDAETRYHLALLTLLRGDLAAGFRDYAWRWRAVPGLRRLPLPAPLWDGSDPAGKTILVADEQGFGDCLMFCRYLPLLRARGARVIYACRPPLLPLFEGWRGADAVVSVAEAGQTVCDMHCSLLDLPALFGTTLETIPAQTPYLRAPTGVVPDSLAAERRLRVGMVWAGNPKHRHDHKRSLSVARFAALCAVAGTRWYSLMRPGDLRPGEAAELAARDIVDLGTEITDFAATARLVAALDLVVTVDTSLAHLAGALGKPVWILLPYAPDWRWLTGRGDSPWYPTARLHRQQRPGDWDTVLEEVRRNLPGRTAIRPN